MDKTKIAITLGIVCLVLTIGICIQVRTNNNANTAVSMSFEEDTLRDEVLRWKEKTEDISIKLDSAEKALSIVREKSTEDDNEAAEIENQIRVNNNLIGLTNVEGAGVEITLKDDQSPTIGIFDDISTHIVHDADLRVIVNDLKNAGAEAISINGQRIVNTTAITCIGNVIKVNDERITSPFIIKAIGFPESLSGIDMIGSYIYYLREAGISVSIKKSNKIEIPKYTGLISAKYMTTQN